MVVYYRITDSHADYYDVSVIPIAAFRRHALWWADYQLQGNLSQTSCLNVALRTTFSMNRHMQALDILSIIIFILGAIVETYATHKTKKYIWYFMSFLCFSLVFMISIVFYSKEDFVFYLGTSASIVCAITSGYKLFAWASLQTQRNKLCISRLIKISSLNLPFRPLLMMRKNITFAAWILWIVANICPMLQQDIFIAIVYSISLVLMGACIDFNENKRSSIILFYILIAFPYSMSLACLKPALNFMGIFILCISSFAAIVLLILRKRTNSSWQICDGISMPFHPPLAASKAGAK